MAWNPIRPCEAFETLLKVPQEPSINYVRVYGGREEFEKSYAPYKKAYNWSKNKKKWPYVINGVSLKDTAKAPSETLQNLQKLPLKYLEPT